MAALDSNKTSHKSKQPQLRSFTGKNFVINSTDLSTRDLTISHHFYHCLPSSSHLLLTIPSHWPFDLHMYACGEISEQSLQSLQQILSLLSSRSYSGSIPLRIKLTPSPEPTRSPRSGSWLLFSILGPIPTSLDS